MTTPMMAHADAGEVDADDAADAAVVAASKEVPTLVTRRVRSSAMTNQKKGATLAQPGSNQQHL